MCSLREDTYTSLGFISVDFDSALQMHVGAARRSSDYISVARYTVGVRWRTILAQGSVGDSEILSTVKMEGYRSTQLVCMARERHRPPRNGTPSHAIHDK
jgi:hypothetical protein